MMDGFCSWSVHHPCKINCYITYEWLCSQEQDGSWSFTDSFSSYIRLHDMFFWGKNVLVWEKKLYHYMGSGATGWSDSRRNAELRQGSTAMATGCDESFSQTSVWYLIRGLWRVCRVHLQTSSRSGEENLKEIQMFVIQIWVFDGGVGLALPLIWSLS